MDVEVIDKLVDEEAVAVFQARQHAGAFHADRLVEKRNDQDGCGGGDEQIAQPKHNARGLARRRRQQDSKTAEGAVDCGVHSGIGDREIVGKTSASLSRLLATEASRRAHDPRAARSHRLRLVDAGTSAGAVPGGPTPARFSSSSCSGRCRTISTWVPVGISTSALRVNSETIPTVASACAQAGQSALNGMPGGSSADRAHSRAGRKSDFGGPPGIAAFIAVLLDRSLAIVFHGLVLCRPARCPQPPESPPPSRWGR